MVTQGGSREGHFSLPSTNGEPEAQSSGRGGVYKDNPGDSGLQKWALKSQR